MEDIYRKEFKTHFDKFTNRYSDWQVWNDFLTIAAVSFANVIWMSEWEKREQECLTIVSRYRREEQELFPQMLAVVTKALEENPEQDFLGETYTMMSLHRHQKGQFFTPYNICEFMAETQAADLSEDTEEFQKKGYLSVIDPACGAGAMLIGFANVMKKHGINYQKKVLFAAQDIDRTAGLMCYIQLSLLGCPAYVIIGDTLAKPGLHPDNEVWYTPFYYLNAWRFKKATGDGEDESVA